MSLIFVDSCGDDGLHTEDFNKWDLVNDAYQGTAYGRFGGVGARHGDNLNTYAKKNFTMSGDTIITGIAINLREVGGAEDEVLLALFDGATTAGAVRINNDRSIEYAAGSTGTHQIKSAAGLVPYQAWCYIELKVKVNDTTGTAELRINEATVASGTSLDTKAGSNTYVDSIQYLSSGTGYLHDVYIDDIYIADGSGSSPYNDFLGDVRVEAIFPDGNGNSSNLTGSDGNSTDNYLLVDEVTPSTSDYVGSSTEGDKDTYTLSALSASTGINVYGIQVTHIQQKDDSGTKYMRPVVRTSSTDYAGTSVPLNTSWSVESEIWETNPNTTNDWTATEVNALEVGPEVRDS